MTVGLLGLQGAFQDHFPHLEKLGAAHRVVRDASGLADIDRLIIPGGESTVMAKFLELFEMTGPLRRRIQEGMPVWGICAGAILLSETIDGNPGVLSLLPAAATRNAYGRQLASRQHLIDIPLFNRPDFPAVFIRAPRIIPLSESVRIHAWAGEDPVFLQHENVMATTFHPELTDDGIFHDYFLRL